MSTDASALLSDSTSALDVSVQAQILNLLSELRAQFNLTFLFISHDLSVIEAISDRVAVLYFGSVVEIGPADKIFINPRHPYTRLLANSAPSIGQELKNTYMPEAELPDPLNPPGGCAFQDRCPLASSKCSHEIPELKSVDDGVKVACHQVKVS